MIKNTLMTVALAWALASSALAEPGNAPLCEHDAKKLISQILNISDTNIQIGSIVSGSLLENGGFTAETASRVTAVVMTREGGLLRRQVVHYDFKWDPSYEWFHQETVMTRQGVELKICSSRAGLIIIK